MKKERLLMEELRLAFMSHHMHTINIPPIYKLAGNSHLPSGNNNISK